MAMLFGVMNHAVCIVVIKPLAAIGKVAESISLARFQIDCCAKGFIGAFCHRIGQRVPVIEVAHDTNRRFHLILGECKSYLDKSCFFDVSFLYHVTKGVV